MAPSVVNQNSLIAWSAVPVVIFLSYLWIRRKRTDSSSDVDTVDSSKLAKAETLEISYEAQPAETEPVVVSHRKSTKSLSGVDSTPIDISYPVESRFSTSNEYVPDEDLDTELQRAKSLNIFDHYQAATSSTSSEKVQTSIKVEPILVLPLKEVETLDQLTEKLKDLDLNGTMTQFDTSGHSEASQPEQGDVLFSTEDTSNELPHSAKSSSNLQSPVELELETAKQPELVESAETATLVEEAQESIAVEQARPVQSPSPVEHDSSIESPSPIEEPSPIQPSSPEIQSSGDVSPVPEVLEPSQAEEIISEKNSQNTEVVENAATQQGRTGANPKKEGGSGKRKRTKFRPLPLETITGGQSHAAQRFRKRQNKPRQNSPRIIQIQEKVEPIDGDFCIVSSSSISSLADSTDSGKGLSDLANSPPPHKVEKKCFSFTLPHTYVSILKGPRCRQLNRIKNAAEAEIELRVTNPRASISKRQQICTIKGTSQQIDHAVNMIKQIFPSNEYPEVTFTAVENPRPRIPRPNPTFHYAPPSPSYLNLVETINNETKVTCVESPDRIHLHLYLEPSNNLLQTLTDQMNLLYANDNGKLEDVVLEVGMGVAVNMYGVWYRAQILSTDPVTDTSVVKLMDYGGVERIANQYMRQYHYSLVGLPFQAIECRLNNVKPKGGTEWTRGACDLVNGLTFDKINITQVMGRGEDDDVPLVDMYDAETGLFINKELVRRGLADYKSYPFDTTIQLPQLETLIENDTLTESQEDLLEAATEAQVAQSETPVEPEIIQLETPVEPQVIVQKDTDNSTPESSESSR